MLAAHKFSYIIKALELGISNKCQTSFGSEYVICGRLAEKRFIFNPQTDITNIIFINTRIPTIFVFFFKCIP